MVTKLAGRLGRAECRELLALSAGAGPAWGRARAAVAARLAALGPDPGPPAA